jgi:hypothetical protein
MGVAALAWLVAFAVGTWGLDGCKGAAAPREQARGAVLTVAEGLRQADFACADLAIAARDLPLAEACADAYDAAREALLAAEAGVDAWDRGAAGEVSCATARAVEGLQRMISLVAAAGGRLPAVVEDALRLAPLLTVGCRRA